MVRVARHLGSRRRLFTCAALILVIVVTVAVHLTGSHECMQRPCGTLLAHGGAALLHSWSPPSPPPPVALLVLKDRPASPRHIEAEPLRPLRAPPASPQAPPARPA